MNIYKVTYLHEDKTKPSRVGHDYAEIFMTTTTFLVQASTFSEAYEQAKEKYNIQSIEFIGYILEGIGDANETSNSRG